MKQARWFFFVLLVSAVSVAFSQTPYGDNPQAGKYASVNGIRIYYEIYGEGMPLLLLHGNGGSIRSQTERIKFFSRKYKVIAVDSRGHGKSIDSTSALTYEMMAKDIYGLLTILKVDSAYIWGQSDGGILALLMAMHHPEKVRKAAGFGVNLRPDTTAIQPELFRWAIETAQHPRDKTEKQHFDLLIHHPHIPASDLKKIRAPFMVMSGDRDAVPLEHSIEIFKNIPKGFLFVMPTSTHFGAYEHTEWFNMILDDFFQKPSETTTTYDKINH